MTFERTKLCLSLLIILIWAAPVSAGEKSPGVFQVSPELSAVLQLWSIPGIDLETMAIESEPEVVKIYAAMIDQVHDEGVIKYFKSAYPEAHDEFIRVVKENLEDSEAFVSYVMGHRRGEYGTWQDKLALGDPRLTFAEFVGKNYPGLLVNLEDLQSTPASKGVRLLDFVRDNADDLVYQQAANLMLQVEAFAVPFDNETECICWIGVEFMDRPSDWEHQENEHPPLQVWGPFNSQQRDLDYNVWAKGAASNIDFYRMSKFNYHQVTRALRTNGTSMGLQMNCTRRSDPEQSCDVSGLSRTCTGNLRARVEYGSEVFEQVEARTGFNREAIAKATNAATLIYSGPNGSEVKFDKVISVAGNNRVIWDPEAVGQLLQLVGSTIVSAITGTPDASIITDLLTSETVTAVSALITHEGYNGSIREGMLAAYDTGGQPISIRPGVTYTLALDTQSEVHGEGHGAKSESWAKIDSYDYFTAVVRDFTCPQGWAAPATTSCWYYANPGAEVVQTTQTIRSNIRSWLNLESGGQFPTLPPQSEGCQ